MNFDLYYSFVNKAGKRCPGVKPNSVTLGYLLEVMKNETVASLVNAYRNGDKEAKVSLPAVCFVGRCKGTRKAENCEPTQLVMADIDHCKNPRDVWENSIYPAMKEWAYDNLLLAHVTCSGEGIRFVFKAQEGKHTLTENMEWLRDKFELGKYGDYDMGVHDFSRISFLSKYEDLLYGTSHPDSFENLPCYLTKITPNDAVASDEPASLETLGETSVFTDDELKRFEAYDYKGFNPKTIVEKWIELKGEPSSGEVHNYYNEMVKNFRNICNNDKRMLLWLLPRFGHTADECWSQIKSITRINTISKLDKDFYFFLKDNGFYVQNDATARSMRNYMMTEEEKKVTPPPYLPPVFRQILKSAPSDFILPCINALMPMLGTLTSYAQARYPYDNRMHTTSFFSVIYAPPGTGKGFVERFMDMLFEELRLRDFVQSQRENVYLRFMSRKSQNEKSPDMPHTSLRLIPPKNSEAEFLQKQRDNHGYHMFTYAAEMDSWAKGVKAAGGNKDDMIRIAWDNGEYGQQFKSVNTFKGTVNLFWNVLITGTIQQLESYFKNVENGLVTRCCFTPIENQEFAAPPIWKEIDHKSITEIKAFCKRCDENTYEEPCTINISDLEMVSDENFDKEVPWQFKFKERVTYDCSWIMPTIEKFHNRHIKKAALDLDNARDVFRRRVAVRGFRLALLCMCLYKKPTRQQLQSCSNFIDWWMERDLEGALKLWGAKYNEVTEVRPATVQRSVFDRLPDEFSRNDVYAVCVKQGIRTPVRRILHEWKKLGIIEIEGKDTITKKYETS